MPDRVGVWDKGMSGGKEVGGEDMSNLLEMGMWGGGHYSRRSATELVMGLD